MTLLLDAGAFVAVERGDRDVVALVKRERLAQRSPVSHGGVVAQIWRGGSGRQAEVARLLRGVDVRALDEELGKKAGVLLGRSRAEDAVDAAGGPPEMSKRNDLMRDAGNILESMGMGVLPAGSEVNTSSVPPQLRGVDRMRDAKMIPLDLIEPDPGQPRKEFDPESLTKLADSLRKRGQIQPITVCWNDSQAAYVILTGERRWRAARQAGLEKLACIVHDKPMTEGELHMQLIENCLREDLKPMEQPHHPLERLPPVADQGDGETRLRAVAHHPVDDSRPADR